MENTTGYLFYRNTGSITDIAGRSFQCGTASADVGLPGSGNLRHGCYAKVESIPFQAIMGISSGVLPLIAYNFASGNRERMHKAVRFALTRGIACAVICFILCEAFAPFIVRFFVDDASSVQYGAEFVRLRTLALPFITVEFMLIAVFQGIGGAKQALFLSLFRKGILDLPLMVFFNLLWPMYGLMLVQPFMECCGVTIAVVLYKKLQNSSGKAKLPVPTNSK